MLDKDEKTSTEILVCVCVCTCVCMRVRKKGGVRKSWCGRVEGAVTRIVLSELRKRHAVGVFGGLE